MFIIVRDSDDLVIGVYKNTIGGSVPVGHTEYSENYPRDMHWNSTEIFRTGVDTYNNSGTDILNQEDTTFKDFVISEIDGAVDLAAMKIALKNIFLKVENR